MNDCRLEHLARVEPWPHLGRPCPNYGQLNLKLGNNNTYSVGLVKTITTLCVVKLHDAALNIMDHKGVNNIQQIDKYKYSLV